MLTFFRMLDETLCSGIGWSLSPVAMKAPVEIAGHAD